jgi:hypothetical protein
MTTKPKPPAAAKDRTRPTSIRLIDVPTAMARRDRNDVDLAICRAVLDSATATCLICAKISGAYDYDLPEIILVHESIPERGTLRVRPRHVCQSCGSRTPYSELRQKFITVMGV